MNPAARRPLVAGNWKMHGNRAEAAALVDGLLARDAGARVDVVVCPPFVHLAEVAGQLGGSPIALGAQDACAEDAGAHTGEISASMLADIGCRYVIAIGNISAVGCASAMLK
jgi:triosephosphate isomerase